MIRCYKERVSSNKVTKFTYYIKSWKWDFFTKPGKKWGGFDNANYGKSLDLVFGY